MTDKEKRLAQYLENQKKIAQAKRQVPGLKALQKFFVEKSLETQSKEHNEYQL